MKLRFAVSPASLAHQSHRTPRTSHDAKAHRGLKAALGGTATAFFGTALLLLITATRATAQPWLAVSRNGQVSTTVGNGPGSMVFSNTVLGNWHQLAQSSDPATATHTSSSASAEIDIVQTATALNMTMNGSSARGPLVGGAGRSAGSETSDVWTFMILQPVCFSIIVDHAHQTSDPGIGDPGGFVLTDTGGIFLGGGESVSSISRGFFPNSSGTQFFSGTLLPGSCTVYMHHGVTPNNAYPYNGSYSCSLSFAIGEPAIALHPDPQVSCSVGTSQFSVTATGTGPFTYQWQWRPTNGQFANILDGVNTDPQGGPITFTASGARTGTVTIENLGGGGTAGSHWEQRCIVSNACGSVTSNPATLTICVADTDDGSGTGTCDGGVTIDDLLYYLFSFEAGDIRSDVDDGSGTGTPDGGVTIDDLLYYLVRFEAGC